jgi:hypothetical protein
MLPSLSRSSRLRRALVIGTTISVIVTAAIAAVVDMTMQDFHLPGTQVGDVDSSILGTSQACLGCHGPYDAPNDPMSTWSGSLMAHAGRDPLFYAQMATANQDVANVGYFCMRCHVPMTFTTGHAMQPDGSTIDSVDQDGINCRFCHSMVDPIYKPGISPPEDVSILAGLAEVPAYYGNAMFVLDPAGARRGPRADSAPMHEFIVSPFHSSGDMCGTCHDVGNVAVTKQPDGTYSYNAIDAPTPTQDLWQQFPLERTYTEWKLSAFAMSGVDMGGRFGGAGVTVVSTCQDCHMPKSVGDACIFGPERSDLARHDFAGAAAPILDLIAAYTQGDPNVDQQAIAVARGKAVSMLERSADVTSEQLGSSLRVRVTNHSGHKLPTGHIEGRQVWVNVKFFGSDGELLREYGHYDTVEAHLDSESTEVYEMHVGLSPAAAAATGYPAGPTTHMALADTIVKDNRIPPRGFNNATFIAAGAPAVGTEYADGQHWDDSFFDIPDGTVSTAVAVYYQNTPRHYIEALRAGNHTNHWGETLHQLWTATGKGAPILIDSLSAAVTPFVRADLDCDGFVGSTDLAMLLAAWGGRDLPQDLNGDRRVDGGDLVVLLANWS